MEDTTPRKRASVTDYANIPNLTKKMLHKSLGMNKYGTKVGLNSSDGRVVWSVCLLSCGLGFNSESGQTNHFNIGIHSFPA